MCAQFKKLKNTLLKNEYPEKVIDLEINKFIKNRSKPIENSYLDSTINQTTTSESSFEQQQIQQLIKQDKQKRFIMLPYCNSKAEKFADRLKHLVESNFDQIDMNEAFKVPNEIGKKFPFKDNVKEIQEQSLVVYKIKIFIRRRTR
jgi:hypothetical protein